jgi:predicted SprT family Zn-dependent metalloprotease
MDMKKKLEEQSVQKFPYQCPYCEHPITYNDLHLKPGENEVKCPSCKRTYIKIVPDPSGKRKKK